MFSPAKWLLLSLLGVTTLSMATELDTLLVRFSQENQLSKKTIDENRGHLVLFTRERLENMHARTLDDVFKTIPVIYYHQNRYGLSDPLTSGAFEPYRSDKIRLYIDGVEITQGWIGSGVMLYGDMDINFVDHIEFYYATPSLDTTVEPAYLSIFLYSKDASRDSGTQMRLGVGTRGYNHQTLQYATQEKGRSYMINFSHTYNPQEKIDNGEDSPLSRDFERVQLFAYTEGESDSFHLQLLEKNMDTLGGLSYDATPIDSEARYRNLHLDYLFEPTSHWKGQLVYERLESRISESDDHGLIYLSRYGEGNVSGTLKTSTLSGELTYAKLYGQHYISMGLKGRQKRLDALPSYGESEPSVTFTKEGTLSLFFQDQYSFTPNSLLSLGMEYSLVSRNGGFDNSNLWQMRLGYIQTQGEWSYKSYLYHTMFSVSPLSLYVSDSTEVCEPQHTIGFTQEIRYTQEDYWVRGMLLWMQDKNTHLNYTTNEKETSYFFLISDGAYQLSPEMSLTMQFYYARYNNIFELDSLDDYSGFLTLSHHLEDNVKLYEGLIWHQNSIDHQNYFDATLALSWELSDVCCVTLKGENLFDNAKETQFVRVNPETGEMLEPLSISNSDRRVTVEVEYQF